MHPPLVLRFLCRDSGLHLMYLLRRGNLRSKETRTIGVGIIRQLAVQHLPFGWRQLIVTSSHKNRTGVSLKNQTRQELN